nr:Pterin-4-alpha-carbinolamine dehydratase [Actinomycetota bacterium]
MATTFATRVGIGSLDEGARLLARIAGLTAAHTSTLQVDVRPESVTIRLPFRDAGSPTREDAELARAISAEAHALGLRAAAGSVQEVQLAIDAMSPPTVIPFWKAVLGYEAMGEEDI